MGRDRDDRQGPASTGQHIVAARGSGATREKLSPGANSTVRLPGGLGQLASGLVKDLQGLVRGEIQLAKTELKEEVTTAAAGAAGVAAGGVVGLVGLVFLMHGIADLLSRRMPRWVADGLVGLTLTAVAAALGLGGKQKLSTANLAPKRTIQTVRGSAAWAKQRLGPVGDP